MYRWVRRKTRASKVGLTIRPSAFVISMIRGVMILKSSLSVLIHVLATVGFLISAPALSETDINQAHRLNEDAFTLLEENNLNKSKELYIESLRLYKILVGEDHLYNITPLRQLADIEWQQNNFENYVFYTKQLINILINHFGENDTDVIELLFEFANRLDELDYSTKAEKLYLTLLKQHKKIHGDSDHRTIHIADRLVVFYRKHNMMEEAESFLEFTLNAKQRAFGVNHPHTAATIRDLAEIYHIRDNLEKAVSLYTNFIAAQEQSLGRMHINLAESFDALALLYFRLRRFKEVERLYEDALAIRERTLEPLHPAIAESVGRLGGIYRLLGRYSEAEVLLRRHLVLLETKLGLEHPDIAQSARHLAHLYSVLARYDEAEVLLKRAIEVVEKAVGPQHPDMAHSLNNLAMLYLDQGQYVEAETHGKRALAIRQRSLGLEHEKTANSLANLAGIYLQQGRYAEAETLLHRALDIQEKILVANHPDIIDSLNSLAILYFQQGRLDEAEKLSKRVLKTVEKDFVLQSIDYGLSLNNLAMVYLKKGRDADADKLFHQAIDDQEQRLGPWHPQLAQSLGNISGLYMEQGRYDEAELHGKRALEIREQVLGSLHPDTALSLENMSALYAMQNRLAEAAQFHQRALEIWEHVLGSKHPATVASRSNLSVLQIQLKDMVNARANLQFALHAHDIRISRGIGGRMSPVEVDLSRVTARFLLQLIAKVPGDNKLIDDTEAFDALQWATRDEVGSAASRAVTLFADGSGELAAMVRALQALEERIDEVDSGLVDLASQGAKQRDGTSMTELRTERARLDNNISALSAKILSVFPAFIDLATGTPAQLLDIQARLAEDELLLAYAVFDENALRDTEASVFVVAVGPNEARFQALQITAETLTAQIASLRHKLDPATGGVDVNFDFLTAHSLYETLLAPFADFLDGARQLYVVPDGALESLPFSLLVTELQSDHPVPAYLARKLAVTTLPSAASLLALRQFAGSARGKLSFIGVGDPVLKGHPSKTRGVQVATLLTEQGLGDVRVIRNELVALPETADELRTVANSLGSDSSVLLLADAATETAVKSIDLEQARVISFATHGLIAGQIEDLAEPSLILTPPEVASDLDDGLLMASEIAGLKLDADLVILSACNTAAPDGTPGAPGLSGLAKAFILAGGRALMVSHWEVYSEAAKLLTTGMIERELVNPTIGHSEALRLAMVDMLNNPPLPEFAHPSAWAPFVIVGDGRARLR